MTLEVSSIPVIVAIIPTNISYVVSQPWDELCNKYLCKAACS